MGGGAVIYPTHTHVSANLKWSELACKDRLRTPWPNDWMTTRAITIARIFEAVRAVVGGRVDVLSAYRTPAHNTKEGGAPNSQHLYGRALDLTTAVVPIPVLHARVRLLAETMLEIGGIGLYDHFVHVDARPRKPDGSIALWDLRTRKV